MNKVSYFREPNRRDASTKLLLSLTILALLWLCSACLSGKKGIFHRFDISKLHQHEFAFRKHFTLTHFSSKFEDNDLISNELTSRDASFVRIIAKNRDTAVAVESGNICKIQYALIFVKIIYIFYFSRYFEFDNSANRFGCE